MVEAWVMERASDDKNVCDNEYVKIHIFELRKK